jgi:P-type Ca2+ transporter type 2C
VTAGPGPLRGHPLGQNVLAGVSAAIAAIPEEPPVLLAVILGLGAYRLLKRGVLVRRLNAEETLGAVDLIITDKTGTLTQNRLVVSSVWTSAGEVEDPLTRRRCLEEALRAEDDAWSRGGVEPGSFTRALRTAVADLDGETELPADNLLDTEPISSEWPLTRTRAMRNGEVEELALGAPEVVLRLTVSGGAATDTDAWRAVIESVTSGGERVVALARRVNDDAWHMRALVGFSDPIRPEISQAMATATTAGIQVIVVTGDHPLTAAAIARAAGLPADRIATGQEIGSWDDTRLTSELADLHVVARSTPDQKLRLVRAARAGGRIVAVTGDGVNDAPALHGASVAAAMGSGTAVAKEASDLVLGDDSFGTLMFGLAEGRRIVDNVQKGLVFVVSTHVAFLGFILISTLAIATRPALVPLQILWMELFIDVSTSIAFERERPEANLMRRPPRGATEPLLTRPILGGIALAGGFSAVAAFGLMLVRSGEGFEYAAWLAYTALVVGQCFRAYWNRSLLTPIHRLPVNGFLLIVCLLAIGIQVLIPYLPPLATAFHARPLSTLDWLLVLLVAVAPALLAEGARSLSTVRRAWVA